MLTMVFIWLGSLLPQKHYQVLSDCQNYPGNTCILLQDYHFQYYLQKYKSLLDLSQSRLERLIMVEKADLLRLLYLYDKGGVYSDLDNSINYTCLENFIEKINETQFFSQEQGKPTVPSNNFIYSPIPKHSNIEYVIKKIKQCEECVQLFFASPYMLQRIGGINFHNVRECIQHGYQSSWKWFDGAHPENYLDPPGADRFANCRKQLKQINQQKIEFKERIKTCSQQNIVCSNSSHDLFDKLETLTFSIKNISEQLNNCEKQTIQLTKYKQQKMILKQSSCKEEENLFISKYIKDLPQQKDVQSCLNDFESLKKKIEDCKNIKERSSRSIQILKNNTEIITTQIESCQKRNLNLTQGEWLSLIFGIIALFLLIYLIKLTKNMLNQTVLTPTSIENLKLNNPIDEDEEKFEKK